MPEVVAQSWALKVGESVPAWVTVVLVLVSAVLSFLSSWLVHRRKSDEIEQRDDHHDDELVAQLQDTWLQRHNDLMDGIADENRRLRERVDNLERENDDLKSTLQSERRARRAAVRFAESQRQLVIDLHDKIVDRIGEDASPVDEPVRTPVRRHLDALSSG